VRSAVFCLFRMDGVRTQVFSCTYSHILTIGTIYSYPGKLIARGRKSLNMSTLSNFNEGNFDCPTVVSTYKIWPWNTDPKYSFSMRSRWQARERTRKLGRAKPWRKTWAQEMSGISISVSGICLFSSISLDAAFLWDLVIASGFVVKRQYVGARKLINMAGHYKLCKKPGGSINV
jgi:hypothetical protein